MNRKKHYRKKHSNRREVYLRNLRLRRIVILGVIPITTILIFAILLYSHFHHNIDADTADENIQTEDTAQPTISSDSSQDASNTLTIPDATDADEGHNTVSFIAAGDNIGHSRVTQYADANLGVADDGLYDFKPIYENVADTIQASDIAFINQETIIGGDHLGIEGYPRFNSPEQWAQDLADIGFDVVNGCTNHTLDKGSEALLNSIDIFNAIPEILYIGVYNSAEDAANIRTLDKNGITFSFLSYTSLSNISDPPNDYCITFLEETKIREDVQKAKSISDVVIVSAHWGTEGTFETDAKQEKYAQLFADLGVDLVVGTHPHYIQPIEWVTGEAGNKTLVAYSLGNFANTMDPVDSQLGIMLSLDFNHTGTEVMIENPKAVPFVNHYDGTVVNLYPLDEYPDKLNAEHYKLATLMPNAKEYYHSVLDSLFDSEFRIQ